MVISDGRTPNTDQHALMTARNRQHIQEQSQ